MVGPTSRTWSTLTAPSAGWAARWSSNVFCCGGVSGTPARMMKLPRSVWITDPVTGCAATAASTCATVGWLAKLSVNSGPPAKSMPSKNPRVAIETMPGMMMISDSRKNRLRRPVMLSLLTRGSGRTSSLGLPSGTMSAACCCAETSESSDTVDSHQHRPAQRAAGHDDRQQVVGHDDRRDQAGHHADAEGDGESLHLARTYEAKDHAGDEGRGVRVADRGPGTPDRRIDRRGDRAAGPHLFLESLEDQHVGVDRHADREDEAGDAGEGQRDRHRLEDREDCAGIEEESDAGQEARDAVVDDHEEDDDRQSEQSRGEAELHRLRAEGRAHLGHREHL